jgi:hypothetical protein
MFAFRWRRAGTKAGLSRRTMKVRSSAVLPNRDPVDCQWATVCGNCFSSKQTACTQFGVQHPNVAEGLAAC